jgi:hypothetical protein
MPSKVSHSLDVKHAVDTTGHSQAQKYDNEQLNKSCFFHESKEFTDKLPAIWGLVLLYARTLLLDLKISEP